MWSQLLSAPYQFETVDAPAPVAEELAPGEAIVKVRAGSICGSDLPLFRGAVSQDTGNRYTDAERYALPPRAGAPMHEVVGDVIATNCELGIGQRIVGWARDNNAISDEIVVDERSVHPLDDLSHVLPVQQTMLQPLACVIHAVRRLPDLAGRHVGVIGLGPLGLLFTHVLRSYGAARVTGVDLVDRADVAPAFGVDEAVRTMSDRWANALTDGERPTLVVEAVGHQSATVNHAIEGVATHGVVYCFGVIDEPAYSVDMRKVLRKQLTVMAGTTPLDHRRPALANAIEYVQAHPDLPEAFVNTVFARDDVQRAYECACSPARGRLKVAVEF